MVIQDLLSILTIRDRFYLLILLCLSVIVSVIELFSLSLVIPFLALVNTPSLISSNKYLHSIFSFFSFTSYLNFLCVFGFILIGIILFRGFVNFFYFYLLTKFSKTRYRTLSFRLFQRYLKISYLDFVRESSASLIHNILNESLNFTSFLYALLLVVVESIVVIFICVALLMLNWEITLILFFAILLVSIVIIGIAKPIIVSSGKQNVSCQKELLETLHETFGNYKFMKLIGNTKHFEDRFYHASSGFVRAGAISHLFTVIPKIIMETGGIVLLLIVLLLGLVLYKDTTTVVAVLTMYTIAFFRLLPSVNRIMSSWSQLVYFQDTLIKLSLELKRKVDGVGKTKIVFNKEITFHGVNFEYESSKPILSNINFTISKGSRVAIVGPSGCGKSTFIDVLAGLLIPNNGLIKVDMVPLSEDNINSWRKSIGYIPQNIYLFNGTIKDNVLCGREEDSNRVVDALKKAKIYDFLITKDGLDTFVGENGVMLSGGQKQRIAIARALYDEPSILVLDEATSALDKETESQIIKEIFNIGKDITIIIVTHRDYFLEKCDIVYRLG